MTDQNRTVHSMLGIGGLGAPAWLPQRKGKPVGLTLASRMVNKYGPHDHPDKDGSDSGRSQLSTLTPPSSASPRSPSARQRRYAPGTSAPSSSGASVATSAWAHHEALDTIDITTRMSPLTASGRDPPFGVGDESQMSAVSSRTSSKAPAERNRFLSESPRKGRYCSENPKSHSLPRTTSQGTSNSKSPDRKRHEKRSYTHDPTMPMQQNGVAIRQLRHDPNIPLLRLLDTKDLDIGFDWRFLDGQHWVNIKNRLTASVHQGDNQDSSCADDSSCAEDDAISEADAAACDDKPAAQAQSPRSVAEPAIQNPQRILHNLTTCVLTGTRQAIERDSYPVVEPTFATDSESPRRGKYRSTRTKWVELADFRRRLFRMSFRGKDTDSYSCSAQQCSSRVNALHKTGCPLVCSALSPLDVMSRVDRYRRSKYKESNMPSLVVSLDIDLDSAISVNNAHPGLPVHLPRPEKATTMEGFFMRSDIEQFMLEAHKGLSVTSSSSLREQFTASQDPYILYCEDATLFRRGAQSGYAFMDKPIVFDMVLYSMSSARPLIRKIKRPQQDPSQAARRKDYNENYYGSEELEKALMLRLLLAADSALSLHGSHSERSKELPILVVALPGCLDGKRHPVGGVAKMLGRFRESHAHLFNAVVVACGEDALTTRQVDAIVNENLYDSNADLNNLLREDDWSQCLKNLLVSLSTNPVWDDTHEATRRRDTLLDRLQAKENLRTLETAMVQGVSKIRANPRGSVADRIDTEKLVEVQAEYSGIKFAKLLREERKRRNRERHEAELSEDVYRLAADFRSTLAPSRATTAAQSSGLQMGTKGLPTV